MAEGRSNAGIAAALTITDGAVEKHVAGIFDKLGLPPAEGDNRRVLAVLRHLSRPLTPSQVLGGQRASTSGGRRSIRRRTSSVCAGPDAQDATQGRSSFSARMPSSRDTSRP